MLTYLHINPVALSLGPLQVHWYGLMYAIGFVGGWLLARYRAHQMNTGWSDEQLSDLIFYTAMGVIVGGRVGYMLLYNLQALIANPLSLFKLWQGGMSFHGGLLGVIVAMWLFSRKLHKPLFAITDFIAPIVPIGLGAGRIGNFINGELWGRVTDAPWAMIFPNAGPLPRHPSQIYEFLLEGMALFIILWLYSSKPRPRMAVSGMFLICYGIFRIFLEHFREPDAPLGFIAFGWLTMGQLLSIPMVLLGIGLMVWAYQKYVVISDKV